MARRKARPKKKEEVHLVFRSHPKGEDYRKGLRRGGIKTHVLERGLGRRKDEPIDALLLSDIGTGDKRNFARYINDLRRKKRNVAVGETFDEYDTKLLSLFIEKQTLWRRSAQIRTLPNIRNYFESELNFQRERHRLIRNTIASAHKKGETPIEAKYGTTHSILRRELRKQNPDIKVSVDLEQQVFAWCDIVTRRLLVGVPPSKISPLEYKRGFLSALVGTELASILTRKKEEELTDRDIKFADLTETTLISRLTEAELDQLIRSRHQSRLLLEKNDLPPNPTRKQLLAFLRKHSDFYRKHWRLFRKV